MSLLSSIAYSSCNCYYSHGGYSLRCNDQIKGKYASQYECSERARALGSSSSIRDPRTCYCNEGYNSLNTTLNCDGQIKGSFRSNSECSGFISTLNARRDAMRGRW